MGRARKSKTSKRDKYASFGDMADEADEDADLPKDEAGRRKIKRQYGELLGIRIEKLRGRILNRERINKTIEGIYFICASCLKVCHSLDDGLSEDPANHEQSVRRMRQGPGRGHHAPPRRPRKARRLVAPFDSIAAQARGRELTILVRMTAKS